MRKRLLAALLLSAISTALCAQDAKPSHGLAAEPNIANPSIARYVTRGSMIPLGKRYEQLSQEEREVLHSMWEGIPAGDEPPFPLYGLRPIHQKVAAVQQRLLVEGPLVLFASVDATGEVTEIKAMGSPNQQMTMLVAGILYDTKFKPARCSGQPCAMQYPFSFNFVAR